jgi:cathepsin B
MQTVVLGLCIVAALVSADFIAVDDALVEKVNSRPNNSWQAGHNSLFSNKLFSQVKHHLGTYEINTTVKRSNNTLPNNLPKAFDSRTNWPSCATIGKIRDQGDCGSCWAFAATEMMSDRFCIASKEKLNVTLAPQDLVSCDTGDYGCQGGVLSNMWLYYASIGTVSEQCWPYESIKGDEPPCRATCVDEKIPFKKYLVRSDSLGLLSDASAAMQDLYTNGPFLTGFTVYQDFMSYKSGVYQHVTGGMLGGHAVKIIGYGTDSKSGLDYWLVANSWNVDWGQNGYFMISRGNNECNFEANMWTASPQL